MLIEIHSCISPCCTEVVGMDVKRGEFNLAVFDYSKRKICADTCNVKQAGRHE